MTLNKSRRHWETLYVILSIEMTIERSVGQENAGPRWRGDGKRREGSENMGLKPKKI